MKLAIPTFAVALTALALAACGDPPPRGGGANNAAAEEEDALPPDVDLSKVELPPPVLQSLAFRCTDGGELFVEVLEDKDSVLVRDDRSETPTKLTRTGGGAFTGDGRSLSGTGDVVTYSSEKRPNQRCGQ